MSTWLKSTLCHTRGGILELTKYVLACCIYFPPVVMGDWGNKLSSGVHIKLLHWERILMMTNHTKKPACGWWLGTVHLICPQHKEVKLITVPTCIVQLCKAVFQARSLLGPDQGKSSLLYLTIPTLQCQYKAKESAIHRREDSLQNWVKRKRHLCGKRWTALTLPSSQPVMTTLSVIGTRQLTASGCPENWSLCKPYWPLCKTKHIKCAQ